MIDPNRHEAYPEMFQAIKAFKPDCLFSFSNFLEVGEMGYLSDLLGIPQTSFLVDPPHVFTPFDRPEELLITSVDQVDATFFKEQLEFTHTLFLPHAADKGYLDLPPLDKQFDIVFLGTFF